MAFEIVSIDAKKVFFFCKSCKKASSTMDTCSECGYTDLVERDLDENFEISLEKYNRERTVLDGYIKELQAWKEETGTTPDLGEFWFSRDYAPYIVDEFINHYNLDNIYMPFDHCPKCGYFKECKGDDGFPRMLTPGDCEVWEEESPEDKGCNIFRQPAINKDELVKIHDCNVPSELANVEVNVVEPLPVDMLAGMDYDELGTVPKAISKCMVHQEQDCVCCDNAECGITSGESIITITEVKNGLDTDGDTPFVCTSTSSCYATGNAAPAWCPLHCGGKGCIIDPNAPDFPDIK